jgi:thiamine transport system permease protein
VISWSAWQALLSTVLTLAAALPAAYVFARYRWRGKTLLRALATVPFVLPTVVVAAAFGALLGPNGMLNRVLQSSFDLAEPPIRLQGTLQLILLAHVFYNFTIVLRVVGGMWANLPHSIEEAAAVLGASRLRVLREITLPILLPAIGAAALLIYIFTFTAFGTVLILGGPRFATVEVEIYRQAVEIFNLPVAAALALLQIGISLVLTWAYTRLQERTIVPLDLRPQSSVERPIRGSGQWLLTGWVMLLMGGLLLAPLLALLSRSLSLGGTWSLEFYRLLVENRSNSYFFVPPATAIRNSVLFALIATMLALGIGLPAAYLLLSPRRRLRALLDPIFMLPLGTSAVTLGFGYIIALDTPPLDLRASPLLIPIAHTLIAFPFVVRALLPVLRGINPRMREAAAVLGASPRRVIWEVDAPIIARAVLIGAVFAFTISLGEFGATLLIGRPEYPTMPVVIFRFLGQPGLSNYGQALAMSTLLMLVTVAGFVAIERLRVGDLGEF